MKLERSNGILFVGCRKDNFRQPLNPDRFKDSESVHLRHLHIEENNIGVLFPDHREGLVVGDQSSNRRILHVCWPLFKSASRWKGISIRTANPPSLAFISSKRK